MSKRKLLWQLFPPYLFIILLSVIVVSIYSVDIIRTAYIEKQTKELEERAYLIQNQILKKITDNQLSGIDSLCKTLGQKSSMRITVINPDGSVIGDSNESPLRMDNHADRPEIKTANTGKTGSSIRYSFTLEKEFLYVAIPLYLKNELLVVLRTSVPLTFIESTVNILRSQIIIAGIIIVFFAAIISLFVVRRFSNPLEEMKQGVTRFARGELSYRISKPKSTELTRLADSLNEMAAQLDDKIKTIIEQKNEQQAVLESMVEGVLAVDKDEKIININRAAAKLFDLNPAESIGRSIHEVIRNADLQKLIYLTLKNNIPVESEILLHNHGAHYLQGNGTVLKNAVSETVGALVVLNDVTKLRRLENMRRDFVANVSHEIRTPLTSIKGFSETLLDGAINDPKSALEFVEIIAKQSNRLNSIIEDLLMLARLEQDGDRAKIDFSDTSVKKILESAIHVCAHSAKEKNIQLILNCRHELKLKLNPDLLEQAVVNLIDNAIKYSPNNKKVDICAEVNGGECRIIVSDEGTGIEKKHLPRLFERFYRVDKSRSRDVGGTGLGLAIVKHIAQVHGGNVSVDSTPGQGSHFIIHLPLKQANNHVANVN